MNEEKINKIPDNDVIMDGKGTTSESESGDLLDSENEENSLVSQQKSINERIRNMSQSTSINGYGSDLFEESSDDECRDADSREENSSDEQNSDEEKSSEESAP